MVDLANKNFNINPSEILALDCNAWIYWKNLDGEYIDCNEKMLRCLSIDSIKGMHDSDLHILKSEINAYMQQDKFVITNEITSQFDDTATVPFGRIYFKVVKSPLYIFTEFNGKGEREKAGLIGISYCQHFDPYNLKLTPKERVLLPYIKRGKTAKEIARILLLSPRTIEHAIARIKAKFHVETRSQLLSVLNIYL